MDDIRAQILSSDEYYNRVGADPNVYVQQAYRDATGRDLRGNEVDQWINRLRLLRNDRSAFVREMVGLIGTGGSRGSDDLDGLTRQMLQASRAFQDQVDVELSGTRQGQRLSLRAQSLDDAVRDFDAEVRGRRNPSPDEQAAMSRALQFVRRAIDAAGQELNNPPGSAPASSGVLRRINQLATRAAQMIQGRFPGGGGFPTFPGDGFPGDGFPGNTFPGGIDPGDGQNYSDAIRLIENAMAANRSVLNTVGRYSGGRESALIRDLEDLGYRLERLRAMTGGLDPWTRMRNDLDTIERLAQRIRPNLAASRTWQMTRMFWSNVENNLRELDQLCRQGDGGIPIDPGTGGVYEIAIQATENAIAEVQEFTFAINPLVFSIPELARTQSEARNLERELNVFRQVLSRQPRPEEALGNFRSVERVYQQMLASWERGVSVSRSRFQADFSPQRVRDAIDDIRAALRGGNGFPGFPNNPGFPGFPSGGGVGYDRIQQLVGALEQEVSNYLVTLEYLGRYPESGRLGSLCNDMLNKARDLEIAYQRGFGDRPPLSEARFLRQTAKTIREVTNVVQNRARSQGSPQQFQRARELQVRSDRIQDVANQINELSGGR